MVIIMKTKLRKIGIGSPEQLRDTVGGKSIKICQLVWQGKRPLSLKMARKIKKKTETSLDFLLG